MSGYTSTATRGVDFSALEVIDGSGGCFAQAFTNTQVADANGVINVFPKLRYISSTGTYDSGVFYWTFNLSYNGTKAIFPSLEYVSSNSSSASNYHLSGTFTNTYVNTVEFSKIKVLMKAINLMGGSINKIVFGEDITYIGAGGIYSLFSSKSNMDFTLPVITVAGDNAIRSLGLSDSVIRFPVLQTIISPTSMYCLYQMLLGGSNNTVHFPISKQSLIESAIGYPNFGGTNTTLLFDLVYTVNDGTTNYTRFHDGYNTTSMGYWHDYFVGANGETYYRTIPESFSSISIDGTVYLLYFWRKSTTAEGSYDVKTIVRNPQVGDTVYSAQGSTVITTVASFTEDRVYVPIGTEPAIGDTLYSDEACTVAVGTVSSIA